MRKTLIVFSSFAVLLSSSGLALASVFPDVPDGHMYQEAVEMLVAAQVINGNPDGTFRPERGVNRAEMLKMLYRAKGKIPDPSSKGCFDDVEPGGWYEPYVCDAEANRYVQGYSDGTFRPSALVNRVEALKMIFEVFDLDVEEITEQSRDIVKFVDVSTSSWYTKYLYKAFEDGILPIPGQEGARFYPNWPLLRGEAATYIYNALTVRIHEDREAQADGMSGGDETQTSVRSSEESRLVQAGEETESERDTGMIKTDFPFSYSGKFDVKKVRSYSFSLARPTDAAVTASLQSGQNGAINCRLYRIKEDGISMEYYLGYQEGKKCHLRTALDAGNYQIDLQPTAEDTTFSVTAEETKGDGNDGFREAFLFGAGLTKTEVLEEHDLLDFYRFYVTAEKKMKVTVSNSAELSCLIYAMEDVDLYGFSGPACGQSYIYPQGTYYIAVGRKMPKSSVQTYTVQMY